MNLSNLKIKGVSGFLHMEKIPYAKIQIYPKLVFFTPHLFLNLIFHQIPQILDVVCMVAFTVSEADRVIDYNMNTINRSYSIRTKSMPISCNSCAMVYMASKEIFKGFLLRIRHNFKSKSACFFFTYRHKPSYPKKVIIHM
ncbi:hypothetical protein ENBRE01_3190 [Enteropsectra breve]|nr:hypothetical protein ENBRE01_3190 [Enteropsectra breve]